MKKIPRCSRLPLGVIRIRRRVGRDPYKATLSPDLITSDWYIHERDVKRKRLILRPCRWSEGQKIWYASATNSSPGIAIGRDMQILGLMMRDAAGEYRARRLKDGTIICYLTMQLRQYVPYRREK